MLNPIIFDQIRSHATGVYVAPRTRIITPDDQIVKPEQVRVARRMIRDYFGRGHSLRDTIERAQSVDAGERKYIQPNKPNASVHIDSFHDYELCILAKDLRELPQFTEDLDDVFIQEKGLSVLMSVVSALPPLDVPLCSKGFDHPGSLSAEAVSNIKNMGGHWPPLFSFAPPFFSFSSLRKKKSPRRQKKPAPFRFRRGGENSISAAFFFSKL